MATHQTTHIAKDLPNKKITVTREFDALPEQVWSAWTESELLDSGGHQNRGEQKRRQWTSGKEGFGCMQW